MAGVMRGHWEPHRTVLGGRFGIVVYPLRRWDLGVYPKAKRLHGLGWVLSLDVHFGRRGVGFWPVGKHHRPGLRWIPDVGGRD